MPRAAERLVLVGSLLAWGCHRDAAPAAAEGGPASASPPSPTLTPTPNAAEASAPAPWPSSSGRLPAELPLLAPAPSGEAVRTTLPSLDRDPQLRAQLPLLREHFGADTKGPLLEQRIERAGGGSAVLLARADESDPIVLALDRDRLSFTRSRPVAGITPPVLHATIAPGPERGVALFAFAQASHLVAARMWADDGNPYAEVVVLMTDSCDALSVAYGVGWGWVIACSSSTGTRAQRLREDLTGSWGTDGAVVGTIGPVERPALVLENAHTWSLTQRAKAVGGDRTLTFRYDEDAQPMPASPGAR